MSTAAKKKINESLRRMVTDWRRIQKKKTPWHQKVSNRIKTTVDKNLEEFKLEWRKVFF